MNATYRFFLLAAFVLTVGFAHSQDRKSIVNQIDRQLKPCYKYEHESLQLENNEQLVHKFKNGTRYINISDMDKNITYQEQDDYFYLDIKCLSGDCMTATWSESAYDNFGFDLYTKACAEQLQASFRQLVNSSASNTNVNSNSEITFIEPYATNSYKEVAASNSYQTIKLTVNISSGVSSVYINEVRANYANGYYTASIPLQYGDNIVTAIVKDNNYNIKTKSLQIRRLR